MTLSKNLYSFAVNTSYPTKSGKGPLSFTHGFAVGTTMCPSLEEADQRYIAFTAEARKASVSGATAPVQAASPSPSKTAPKQDRTSVVVDKAIASFVAKGDGRHNVAFYRPVRKAAIAGTKSLRAYRSGLAAPKGPYKAALVASLLHTLGS